MQITNIYIAILLLVIGFVFLIKGADFFVDGSSSVAKRLKVPSIIVGLTIVAMGTSLPETAVSVWASIGGNNELAISNAVGSNIFNLMVVIGVCAVMTVIPVGKDTIKKDIPISILCALALGIMGAIGGVVGRLEGAVLLLIFAGFLVYMFVSFKKSNGEVDNESIEQAQNAEMLPVWKTILYIIGGAAGIAIGGDVVVDSASYIATSFGMTQTLVGLTIVSVGTSLPELVTSFVAAKKNEIGMALGNAIGSNVFNIGMVLGIASVISPINVINENIIDIIILIVFSLLVWAVVAWKKELKKLEGFVMLALYSGYLIYIICR